MSPCGVHLPWKLPARVGNEEEQREKLGVRFRRKAGPWRGDRTRAMSLKKEKAALEAYRKEPRREGACRDGSNFALFHARPHEQRKSEEEALADRIPLTFGRQRPLGPSSFGCVGSAAAPGTASSWRLPETS